MTMQKKNGEKVRATTHRRSFGSRADFDLAGFEAEETTEVTES
jgi:hypothetical protein